MLKLDLDEDDEDLEKTYNNYFKVESNDYNEANADDFVDISFVNDVDETDGYRLPLLDVSDGIKTEDLYVIGDVYNKGGLRNGGNARFETRSN